MREHFQRTNHNYLTRNQLGWFLFYRVLLLSLFLGGTILYLLRGGLALSQASLAIHYSLVALYYLQALLVSAALRYAHHFRSLVHIQIVWDLLFSATLIYVTGGLESHFSFLFLLIILGSGLLLRRREALIVSSASAILYGSLLDLQYYGYLPRLKGIELASFVDARDVFLAVFVNVVAFFLVGLLSGFFADRIRRGEIALERRQIDYDELEKFNRAILANIGSGLMVVNSAGRIRSFNQAAERITRLSLLDVYNRDVRQVFPELGVFARGPIETRRGEGRFTRQDKAQLTLGYSATLLSARDGVEGSLLIGFQDLTHMRDMELRLQQADRLAAVGKMASGMAHEIRNPLASISGSLQLLMEGGQIATDGERLAKIVVREAERLSGLITDFLIFARPAQPKLERFDLSLVCDEVIEVAQSSPVLNGVELIREYFPGQCVYADREQIRQVVWNVLINAAEAMPDGGTVRLSIDANSSTFTCEDSGPGIPEEVLGKVFDPFFTTKEMGTGLGLATVYSTIEAHRGEVQLAVSDLGGASLQVCLPKEDKRSIEDSMDNFRGEAD